MTDTTFDPFVPVVHTHIRAEGLHAPFEWSCVIECQGSTTCGQALLAGTDGEQRAHAYGLACSTDVIANTDGYEEGLRLHGTHEFDAELLGHLYGPDRGMPPQEVYNNLHSADDVVQLTTGESDDSIFAVAAVTSDGRLAVVSMNLYHEYTLGVRAIPYGMSLLGTHVLPDFVVTSELFRTTEQD